MYKHIYCIMNTSCLVFLANNSIPFVYCGFSNVERWNQIIFGWFTIINDVNLQKYLIN